jgi:hypothetical protein
MPFNDNTRQPTPDPNADLLRTVDTGQGYKVLAVKVHTGDLHSDNGPAVPGSGLPVTSNGDYITSSPMNAAQQTTVGTSAVQLPSQAATRRVVVKALNGNSGTVYVGLDSGVLTSMRLRVGTW